MTTACRPGYYENAFYVGSSTGISRDASFVTRKQTEIQRDREDLSQSINKGRLRSMLREAYMYASQENWDSYGAKPANLESFQGALRLIDLLPSAIPIAEISVDANGEIVFEWYRKRRYVFSITVEDRAKLIFVGLFGPSKLTGLEFFENNLPRSVSDGLVRLFQ